MNQPVGRVLFDSCTLENFSAVGRLDLLRTLYGQRCSWVTGVRADISPRLLVRPDLQAITSQWLGEPIEETEPSGVQQIDRIRRALGGSPMLPHQHLAESQAIYHITEIEKDDTFATDDRGAYAMASRRGGNVIDTPDILISVLRSWSPRLSGSLRSSRCHGRDPTVGGRSRDTRPDLPATTELSSRTTAIRGWPSLDVLVAMLRDKRPYQSDTCPRCPPRPRRDGRETAERRGSALAGLEAAQGQPGRAEQQHDLDDHDDDAGPPVVLACGPRAGRRSRGKSGSQVLAAAAAAMPQRAGSR